MANLEETQPAAQTASATETPTVETAQTQPAEQTELFSKDELELLGEGNKPKPKPDDDDEEQESEDQQTAGGDTPAADPSAAPVSKSTEHRRKKYADKESMERAFKKLEEIEKTNQELRDHIAKLNNSSSTREIDDIKSKKNLWQTQLDKLNKMPTPKPSDYDTIGEYNAAVEDMTSAISTFKAAIAKADEKIKASAERKVPDADTEDGKWLQSQFNEAMKKREEQEPGFAEKVSPIMEALKGVPADIVFSSPYSTAIIKKLSEMYPDVRDFKKLPPMEKVGIAHGLNAAVHNFVASRQQQQPQSQARPGVVAPPPVSGGSPSQKDEFSLEALMSEAIGGARR
jgi:hypothetical protein